ncbi:GNAT family N-acetyltransferase [Brachybacterium hainanense]|uniref:GNAT family N-acetyltransferase n=1 Tax=Brachybacterium hainanense TaxID=1541174 RepID=A0ABV6RIG2_9MICO
MAMFRRGEPRVRPVRHGAEAVALRLALRDPLRHALPGARLAELRGTASLPQEFSLVGPDAEPTGLLWHGVNIAPMAQDPAVLDELATAVLSMRRRASSIVGERSAVARIWRTLAPAWAPAVREYRWSQPLLVAAADAGQPPVLDARAGEGPGLRPARPEEAEAVYHHAVAMFREEVGTDPTSFDGGRAYWARVRSLIGAGRTYIVVRDEQIIFKADVGAVFGPVAQIHGVWVPPAHRGRGVARSAMADLVAQVRRDHAPQVSLYVNDFNVPARRAYAAAGFVQAGELTTILF